MSLLFIDKLGICDPGVQDHGILFYQIGRERELTAAGEFERARVSDVE